MLRASSIQTRISAGARDKTLNHHLLGTLVTAVTLASFKATSPSGVSARALLITGALLVMLVLGACSQASAQGPSDVAPPRRLVPLTTREQ